MTTKPRQNDQLGFCECTFCNSIEATVHKMRRSTKIPRYYFNCPNCGCIQPSGRPGQEYIRDSFRPLDPSGPMLEPLDGSPAPVVEIPEPAPVPIPDEPRESRWLDDE